VIPRSAETSTALYRDRRIAVTPRGPARRLARRPRRVDRAHRGGVSLPLPALPSDEPLPFEPLFAPLRCGPLRGPPDVPLVSPDVPLVSPDVPLVSPDVPLLVARSLGPLVVPLPV
jgi:hypothetical protein